MEYLKYENRCYLCSAILGILSSLVFISIFFNIVIQIISLVIVLITLIVNIKYLISCFRSNKSIVQIFKIIICEILITYVVSVISIIFAAVIMDKFDFHIIYID